MGSLTSPQSLLTIAGVLITLALYYYRIPGAIFLGMMVTTILGLVTGLVHAPSQVVSSVPSLKPTFGVAFSHLPSVMNWHILPIVLTFFLVAFFDTTGTILGVQKQMGTDRDTNKSLIASALGNISAAIFGTSPATAFVESNAGVSAGGRTGLTSVVVAILFALSLFFSPLLTMITPQITASALIVVGVLMLGNLKDIDWNNFKIAASAFLIVLGMPLTHSISDGILLGGGVYLVLSALDWIKNNLLNKRNKKANTLSARFLLCIHNYISPYQYAGCHLPSTRLKQPQSQMKRKMTSNTTELEYEPVDQETALESPLRRPQLMYAPDRYRVHR
ncbi:Guanine/hypoxanthine permease pbuG [Weissella viridescens]|uniref:Guanine/hypoxanthine permease pbuG n=1 Tax=Weissella viridescens TaxID=1629 RepID=A0A380P7F8_WEIVI|nr:Guanine/hypoxanthine permease pbuG [Weissella viridescens]